MVSSECHLEDESKSDGGSGNTSFGSGSNKDPSSSRDEVEEIRKQSQKETARVRFWRALVFVALLATAVAVTATTYTLLVKQEDENFRNVVRKATRFEFRCTDCSSFPSLLSGRCNFFLISVLSSSSFS